MRSRVAGLPAWLLLAGIVALSAGVRLWLVRGMVAPFIFVDELIYSELAKSLAEHGTYAIRETPTRGYSLLYPAVVAPAWGLFDDGVTAYNAAKSINAVVMSFVAVPTYFLAARVARPPLALLAAAISVAVPSMAYAGTITTESLFYPVAVGFALAFARYLEQPSRRRLLIVLAALIVSYGARPQAIVFVPVLLTAPLVLAVFRGSRTELRPFRPLALVVVGAAALVVVGQAVRGQTPLDLLGSYHAVGERHYDVGQVVRYWLWHVEELILYAAVVPVAATAILVARARTLAPPLQAFLAATVSLFAWSTLQVGMFASSFAPDRVQDRYLFFLVPLLVVGLVAWIECGSPRPVPLASIISVAVLALVLAFPYGRFIGESAKSDTLGLIPLWAFQEHLLVGSTWVTVAVAAGAFLVLFLVVRARWAVVVPLVLLAVFVLLSRPVWTSDKGFVVAGKGALRQGIAGTARTWIDDAVDGKGEVVALWTQNADRFTVQMNEFFNRSVGRVLYTVSPTPGGLPETPVTSGPGLGQRIPRGYLWLPSDGAVVAPFALLDSSVDPNGRVVARDKTLGMRVFALVGPLADKTSVTGLYPYPDTWSGPKVSWRRVRCAPGTLHVTVHSDPNLFTGSQTVRLVRWISQDVVGARSVRVPVATDRTTFSTVVKPDAGGVCRVRFTIDPTANPSKVIPGSTDDRVLGMHFDEFRYVPGGTK